MESTGYKCTSPDMDVYDKYKDMRCCKFCNERLTCNGVVGKCGCEDTKCEFITRGE